MSVGFIYTYLGLVLFLTGANIGFMPAGRLIGAKIAESNFSFLLVPIGMLMGYFVVSAESAVNSLKRQISEITQGSISQKSVALALSIGVSVSVGISMLRVLTGIPIMPFLIAGYMAPLITIQLLSVHERSKRADHGRCEQRFQVNFSCKRNNLCSTYRKSI